MIADATGRPVIAGPVEATAIGNLLVQVAAREGRVDLRALRAIVRDSFELDRYEPANTGAWEARLGG
jgi:rhamnulokinase